MSVFDCIEFIDRTLVTSQKSPPSRWQKLISFILNRSSEKSVELRHQDAQLLTTIKEHLNDIIMLDKYDEENLRRVIDFINEKRTEVQHQAIVGYLIGITNDLENICSKIKQKPLTMHTGVTSIQYKKYQTKEYLIAEIDQGGLFKLGGSSGECLGFTYAMADPKLSPYKNPNVTIDFNQQVHDYQRFQSDRKKDQGRIKGTRLTRMHFCSNQEQQANNILKFAEEHKGKDLHLYRKFNTSGHACYLCIEENTGYVRYMDPNHGAYLFKHRDDFIQFYIAAADEEKKHGIVCRFYSLSELKVDEANVLKESKTWGGVIRSILTGVKYSDNITFLKFGSYIFYGLLGAGVGAGIGAIVGSVLPVIGTAIGALIGVYLGGLGGIALNYVANSSGYDGLLGGAHFIQDKWQDLKDYYSAYFLPSPQNDIADDVEFKSSEANILSGIRSSLSDTLPTHNESLANGVTSEEAEASDVVSQNTIPILEDETYDAPPEDTRMSNFP